MSSYSKRSGIHVKITRKKKYIIFFFFKQKTAYEIYQCDWSSDVCSSDLGYFKAFKKFYEKVTGKVAPEYEVVRFKTDAFRRPSTELIEEIKDLLLERIDNIRGDRNEIGRASCRERV